MRPVAEFRCVRGPASLGSHSRQTDEVLGQHRFRAPEADEVGEVCASLRAPNGRDPGKRCQKLPDPPGEPLRSGRRSMKGDHRKNAHDLRCNGSLLLGSIRRLIRCPVQQPSDWPNSPLFLARRHRSDSTMLTLYSYPELCGVADNNGYGLKVFAFLRLTKLPFVHEHIFDASSAPRAQLPYIVDDGQVIGDSETIIDYLIPKYRL